MGWKLLLSTQQIGWLFLSRCSYNNWRQDHTIFFVVHFKFRILTASVDCKEFPFVSTGDSNSGSKPGFRFIGFRYFFYGETCMENSKIRVQKIIKNYISIIIVILKNVFPVLITQKISKFPKWAIIHSPEVWILFFVSWTWNIWQCNDFSVMVR